jgi:uncharacterized RDD family membrane protein YckC
LVGVSIPENELGCSHMTPNFVPVMKSRFQPDADFVPGPAPTLIDPEAFDVSEQQFAASLEEKSDGPQSRFVLEHNDGATGSADAGDSFPAGSQSGGANDKITAKVATESPCQPPEPDSWRREVAARVNHYRGKRPRAPRYPSLQLSFESTEPSMIAQPAFPTAGQLAITMDPEAAPVIGPPTTQPVHDVPAAALPDVAAKILAFPRSSFMPPMVVEDLAEPVFHRPRILEVPEVLPPPPALGGILIESSEEPKEDRRPGFELPLKPARLTRRILAGMTDAVLVVAAFSAFAYIFFRVTSIIPPLREGVVFAAGMLAVFWSGYQYLLLVHTGSTPGLKLAKLELSRFDGRLVPRRLRRWRVLASVLSGLSLALGYAWCFLDEDELCWHDRITHTYMAPTAAKATLASTPH